MRASGLHLFLSLCLFACLFNSLFSCLFVCFYLSFSLSLSLSLSVSLSRGWYGDSDPPAKRLCNSLRQGAIAILAQGTNRADALAQAFLRRAWVQFPMRASGLHLCLSLCLFAYVCNSLFSCLLVCRYLSLSLSLCLSVSARDCAVIPTRQQSASQLSRPPCRHQTLKH